jgi:hypothetical protein
MPKWRYILMLGLMVGLCLAATAAQAEGTLGSRFILPPPLADGASCSC